MTDNQTWPAPGQAPAPVPTPKKSHKVRTTILVVLALWVVGAAISSAGSNSNSTGSTSSDSGSSGSSSTGGSSSSGSSGQTPGKCSIFHKGYSDCIDTQVHDQMNDYYTRAESCDIQSTRYLQCLNDADLASKRAH